VSLTLHTAIVTGGTRGIGYGIAEALVTAGAKVMITGRDAGRVTDAVGRLAVRASDKTRVLGQAVDVRKRAAVDALVADTVREFGPLNTLINNAGVGLFTEVEKTTDEDWSRVIDTNLTGVFHCSRAAIPPMRHAGGGWIINIASLAGRNYFANGAAYCASKAGLVAFSESLMLEVRNDNIRVSVVMPGSVATDFIGPSGRDIAHGDDSWKLTPADIAAVVLDLLRHPTRSLPSKVEIRPARTK
jgi:NAD(P)-dependent dehydrogenase (short-subunit alcohol dehydrogenase family)